MTTERIVNFVGKVILLLIIIVIAGNSAFVAGYLRGVEKGRQEVMQTLPLTPVGELRIRERIGDLQTEFNGPMYSKPDLESRGRVGW